MKKIRLALIFTFLVACFVAQAQVNFDDPRYEKWGPDAASREANLLTSTFLADAINNRDYNDAAAHFQKLITACPDASEAVFQRGVILYRAKIARAKNLAEKKQMVDSLMIVHDLRLKYFSDHPKRGKTFILDSKVRDFYNYKKSDRAGLRTAFREAIEGCGDKIDAQLVVLYFQNLCEDFKMDEVMADEVMSEYDRLTPYFDSLESEYTKFRDDFTNAFSISGVATCENLESIFSAKLIATPDDVDLLTKCSRLMTRLKCTTPFYISVVERLYELAPTSQAAMSLAAIFQDKKEYSKAVSYLQKALASEEDSEERETLNARIALIELASNNMAAAAAAARESINTPDDTKSDNGIAYFVLSQCYAAAAEKCTGFDAQAMFWVAYDIMDMAVKNFTPAESDYKNVAQQSMVAYKNNFPSQEECFFNELKEGDSYTLKCGMANGYTTTVRVRK